MLISARRTGRLLSAMAAAAVAAVLITPAPAAFADSITYTAPSWTVSQVGTIMTVTTSFTSSTPTTVQLAGVCAHNATNGLVNFPFTASVPLSATATTIKTSRSLTPGKYTMYACLKSSGGYWHNVSSTHTVTVSDPATTPTYPAPVTNPTPSTPGGQPMPVGDLPGWHQIFSDDFTTAQPQGTFPGSYAAKWHSYNGFPDNSGNGMYNQNIISMHNGEMDLNLQTINGVPQGAAPSPIIAGNGQTYGRYTVRFRSDWLPGYGSGWLLWPDSGNWSDGEIDFPEGGLAGAMQAYDHCIGDPSKNCTAINTGVTFIDWHTATIEWSPTGVFFILDGKVLGSSTTNIPIKPLHWVLQTGTSGPLPAATLNGHVLIDWVAVYTAVGIPPVPTSVK